MTPPDEEMCTLCAAEGRSTPAVLVAAFAYCQQHLREAQDRAVHGAADRSEQFGSAGEAVMSDHVRARRLRRTGDPLDDLAADGHDMSGQARVDTEISGWPADAVTDNPAVGVVGDPADLGLPPWSQVSRPGSPGDPAAY